MKQVALKDFLKKYREVFITIATSKMELPVELVISFRLRTNFTKIPKIGAMGVLNAPLKCDNVF